MSLLLLNSVKHTFMGWYFNIQLLFVSVINEAVRVNCCFCLKYWLLIEFMHYFFKAAFVSDFLMAREFILFGWMSRVWHLQSHMPIRHLCLLITSQTLGLHCSGSHTWLHPDYILPQASLIWLFMGQAVLSIGWQNVTTDWKTLSWTKTSNEYKHHPEAPQYCFFEDRHLRLPYSVRYGLQNKMTGCFFFSPFFTLKSYLQLCSAQAHPVCACQQRWNTDYPEHFKKEKLLSC